MSDPLRERSDSRPGSEWQSARTPSHLTSYDQPSPAGRLPGAGEHRRERLGHRLRVRVQRLAHPVDHPVALVLALAADREERPAAGQVLAVKLDLDLALLPDEQLEGPAVVDPHPSRRRTGPPGCRRGSRGTRPDGPRCAPRAGCRRRCRGRTAAAPTTSGRRRARAAGPSADASRRAPARRSAARRGVGAAAPRRLGRVARPLLPIVPQRVGHERDRTGRAGRCRASRPRPPAGSAPRRRRRPASASASPKRMSSPPTYTFTNRRRSPLSSQSRSRSSA